VTTSEFIEKAKGVHGESYGYSLVIYKNNKTKVKIICPTHGVFEQGPGSHINQGSKCPLCSSIKLDLKEFIKRAKKIHQNKYDYSKTLYVNSRTKVIVTCKKHGDFNVRANSHLINKNGCKKCSDETRIVSFDVFMCKSQAAHKNKYVYPKQGFKGTSTKVKIICPKHGEFIQSAQSHMNGIGCARCARKYLGKLNTYSNNDFISTAREVHCEKYDYSLVNYINSSTKIKIICEEHGEFEQRPNNHLNGQGCPVCGYILVSKKGRKKWNEIYLKLIEVHGDKYTYDASTYLKASSKIDVYCKIHDHKFKIAPVTLIGGQGCYHCGIDKIKTFFTKDWESTFDLIKQTHGDRYKYSVNSFKGRRKPMEIICAEHGTFMQSPSIHIADHGCPKCGVIYGSNLQRGTLEKFIKRAKKMHGDLYDYSKVKYIDVAANIEIICQEHGSFFMSPNSHTHSTQSRGCPKCYTSSGERLIMVFLEKHELKYETQKKFDDLFSFRGKTNRNKLKCDFYLPSINTVIEYNGKQHYMPLDIFGGKKSLEVTRRNDRIKEQYCKQNDIKFEIIRYNEDVETCMFEILKKHSL